MEDADLSSDLAPSLRTLAGGSVPRYSIAALQGDASSRRYYRVEFGADSEMPASSMIVMRLPKGTYSSDEGGGETQTDELPFLVVGSLLADRNVRVPEVYAEDLDRRILILEDLGDQTFERFLRSAPRSEWKAAYRQAIDLLANMHDRCADLTQVSLVSERAFDRQLFEWELEHFSEWGLAALGIELSDADDLLIKSNFHRLAGELASLPQGFVHRDYQSKNLMRSNDGSLVVIDFQDAMVGPRVYDLVALLCDSYVSLENEFQESMIAHYSALRSLDVDTVRREFWLVALQRKLKDTGRFVFIDRVRGNPRFLQWFSQSYVYVGRALEHVNGYKSLLELLKNRVSGFPDRVPTPGAVSTE